MATPFVPVPASRAHSGTQPRVSSVTSIAAQHCGLGAPDFPCAKPLEVSSLRYVAASQKHQGEAV
jgi:hypothetical protein